MREIRLKIKEGFSPTVYAQLCRPFNLAFMEGNEEKKAYLLQTLRIEEDAWDNTNRLVVLFKIEDGNSIVRIAGFSYNKISGRKSVTFGANCSVISGRGQTATMKLKTS